MAMTDEELLSRVKTVLRVDFDDDDTILQDIISAGKKYITNEKGIEFSTDNFSDLISLYTHCRTYYDAEIDSAEVIRRNRSAVMHDILNKEIAES